MVVTVFLLDLGLLTSIPFNTRINAPLRLEGCTGVRGRARQQPRAESLVIYVQSQVRFVDF